MARLLVHVEGETEESFVNELLRDHLVECGYESVGARLIGNARLRLRRGGIRPWATVKNDIVRHLKEDQGCISTTMVDYYGLPQIGEKAWPGRAKAAALAVGIKASAVESALHADVVSAMGQGFDSDRFVPFVVLHEFEGLLFSDCAALARGLYRPDLRTKFQQIRNKFATPEEINDSPITAPSKRIIKLMPDYDKPLSGNLAAIEVGLDNIERACPHFHEWLERLEFLAR